MGKTKETVRDFIFLGSKITADNDYSHEIKRRLLHGRKAMTNLASIIKNGDITLTTKVHLVKAMVFPVVVYGCESWTIKKLSATALIILNCQIRSDQISHSVLSDSLRPHESKHARPPCPSPTPRVHSNSRPPSQ